jgi:protein involved in polysaccharide export with SLBB domain
LKKLAFTLFSEKLAETALASDLLFSLLRQSIPGQDGDRPKALNFHKPFQPETAIKTVPRRHSKLKFTQANDSGSPQSGFSFTLILVMTGLLASACGPSVSQQRALMMMAQVPAEQTSPAKLLPEQVDPLSYRLAPGDLIDVKFTHHPEENERVPLRPDGLISLQIAGDINAAGLTVAELQRLIVEKSSATLRDPVVSVIIAQLAEHKVYVGGDVAKPGFVNFRDGLTPLQAVIERGGFTDTARMDEVLYVTRMGGEIQTQRLDLEAVVQGDSPEEIYMAPDDIVFVPKTFIGQANIWVDQWIRGLLPTVPRPGFDLNAMAF